MLINNNSISWNKKSSVPSELVVEARNTSDSSSSTKTRCRIRLQVSHMLQDFERRKRNNVLVVFIIVQSSPNHPEAFLMIND